MLQSRCLLLLPPEINKAVRKKPKEVSGQGTKTSYPKVLFKALILFVNILYTIICAYVPLP